MGRGLKARIRMMLGDDVDSKVMREHCDIRSAMNLHQKRLFDFQTGRIAVMNDTIGCMTAFLAQMVFLV